jgi:hypothetical protein
MYVWREDFLEMLESDEPHDLRQFSLQRSRQSSEGSFRRKIWVSQILQIYRCGNNILKCNLLVWCTWQ